jgi:hypothetical protein
MTLEHLVLIVTILHHIAATIKIIFELVPLEHVAAIIDIVRHWP